METRSRKPRRKTDRSPKHQVTSYWERTLWPLQSLYFLLPLLIAYEIGTLLFAPAGDERLPQIYAEHMLGQFFQWFGVTGYYLPGIATVVLLLCLHFARGDPWRPEPPLYLAMLIESAVLAAPLYVFSVMLTRGEPTMAISDTLLAGGASGLPGVITMKEGMVFAVGAGIYEELLFRLIAIALLHLLLSDLLALPKGTSAGLAIAVSAIAFALYHPFDTHLMWRWTSGDWGRFAFYTLAGLYFAAIYVYRGFGIVAAAHAIYDIMVIVTHFNQR